jgi:hypothetical protein
MLLSDRNTDYDLFESLTHCLINILYMLNQQPLIDYNKDLMLSLKENILKLGEAFKVAEASDDIEK